MNKTSRVRLALRPLIFSALMIGVACAGLSLRGDGFLRNKVSAQSGVVLVNAASFANDRILSPDSIGAAFGQFVTQNNQIFFAQTQPLPFALGGMSVKINNVDAGLFFVSGQQINLQVPASLADNPSATITVTNSDGSTRTGTCVISRSSPGVFTVNSSGIGLAVAQSIRNGVFENIFNPDLSPRDVNAGTKTDPTFLVIYATGVRNAPPGSVTVKFQGVPRQADFAGAVFGLTSLDQINVVVPPELAGLGMIRVDVSVNGRNANTVMVRLGGEIPDVVTTAITPGTPVNGELTAMDQVQFVMSTGDTFFFDAYDFTTTGPNTTIAVDLRSTQFDAGVLLYRVDPDPADPARSILTLLAADDQSGGYGATVSNNDSLLLTVLPTAARYVILASTSDFQPNGVGTYSLTLFADVITPVAYGQTVNGAIGGTDLRTSGGTLLDAYWFNGSQGDRQQIIMRSTAFDSFLVLQGNDGDPPLTGDDNSGGGLDSQISPIHGDIPDFPPLASLPRTGIYIVIATPLDAGVSAGAYTLSLNRLSSFGPETARSEIREAKGRRFGFNVRSAESVDGTTYERFGRRRIVHE